MARKVPEINSSSQADIAFLLLCFFLMTTSMDVDYGITRRLPPIVEQEIEDVKVKERNVMNVWINKSDNLMVNGERMELKNLKEEAKRFMTPRENVPSAPETEYKYFEELGANVLMTKGVISLQSDRATSYRMYISVQNELARAFNELRDEKALMYYQKEFKKLDENEAKVISDVVPIRISEAEPK